MKTRILTLLSLGFLTILIIYSCNLTSGTVSNLNNTICSNYTDMSTLEVNLIHEMTNMYKENQLLTINDNLNDNTSPYFNDPQIKEDRLGDARAIWFDLETLKAFIYHIEAKAKNHPQPVQSKDLGIRIYFASYPDFEVWEKFPDLPGTGNNKLTNDYSKRHTLVMVPTIRRGDLEVDFNPLDNSTYYGDILLTTTARYLSGSSYPFPALTGIPSSGPTGAQNHGAGYPPLGDPGLGF